MRMDWLAYPPPFNLIPWHCVFFIYGVAYAFSSRGDSYISSLNKVLEVNTDILLLHLRLNSSVIESRKCLQWNPRGNLTHRDANVVTLAETIARTSNSVVPHVPFDWGSWTEYGPYFCHPTAEPTFPPCIFVPRVKCSEFQNDTVPCASCSSDVVQLSSLYSRFSSLLRPYRTVVRVPW